MYCTLITQKLYEKVAKTAPKMKSMAYVVEDGKESILGRRDGEALGIIKINPDGEQPKESLK